MLRLPGAAPGPSPTSGTAAADFQQERRRRRITPLRMLGPPCRRAVRGPSTVVAEVLSGAAYAPEERTRPMTQAPDPIAVLTADGDEVDRMVADLDPAGWQTPTPAPGWTVAHQVAHLAATFQLAAAAAGAPEMFKKIAAGLSPDFDANVRGAMAPYLAMPPEELLAAFRSELRRSIGALRGVPADALVPWLVRPLPPGVLAAAGQMELFGHGQDIADGLGITR